MNLGSGTLQQSLQSVELPATHIFTPYYPPQDEFDGMLENDSIKSRPVPVPVLVFANKMDVKDAMDHVEVSEGLGLAELSDRPWHIEASNALTGEGLDEGVKWLGAQVTKQKEEAKGGGGAGAAKGGAGAGAGR